MVGKMKRKDYIQVIKNGKRKTGGNKMENKAKSKKFKNYMKHAALITTIADLKNDQLRKKLISQMPHAAVLGIKEIIDGILNKDIPLSPAAKNKLKKHEKVIIKIMKSKNKAAAVKKHISQKGGFIGALAPLAISAVAPIAQQLIGGILGAILPKRK